MCAHGGAVRCKLICIDVALFCEVLWGFVWGPLVAVVGLFEGSSRFRIKAGRVSNLGSGFCC